MVSNAEWGLVREADGGISGVYSLSEDKPFKLAGFDASDAAFEQAASYRDWVFRFDSAKTETTTTGKEKPAARPKAPASGVAPAN